MNLLRKNIVHRLEKLRMLVIIMMLKRNYFLKISLKSVTDLLTLMMGTKNIFFDCLKTDLKNNEDEIKNNIDFSLIDERTTFIFNNMLKSSHYWELELRIRCFDLNTKSKN